MWLWRDRQVRFVAKWITIWHVLIIGMVVGTIYAVILAVHGYVGAVFGIYGMLGTLTGLTVHRWRKEVM